VFHAPTGRALHEVRVLGQEGLELLLDPVRLEPRDEAVHEVAGRST